MNKEDLAKLYEKANGWSPAPFQITMEELARFAALVAADAVEEEREECAKLCDYLWESKASEAYECATAIRKRVNYE